MSRYDHQDIITEIIELCGELSREIVQQLTYYRASVYKDETAKVIDKKIEQLRMVANLLSEPILIDHFEDFNVTKGNGNIHVAPGECYYSHRVTTLLSEFRKTLEDIQTNHNRMLSEQPGVITKNIKKNRNKLLLLCKKGTRQWNFFQTL